MLKVVFLPCLSLLNPSDVTDTDDGIRENSKPPPCEDSLAHSEAEPESEAVAAEADSEPEPEVDAEAEPEVDADAEPDVDEDPEVEPELAEMDAEAMNSSKEAEEDHLSVSIPNEDAITLDVDGDDLLETGKHVKLPDPEAEKGTDEPEASAEMSPDDDMKAEESEGHRDGKKDDGSRGEPVKKDGRDALKKAETGDKEKDSGKKGPCTTGASGQAKRFVFLCQFFDTTTKSSSLRTQHCGQPQDFFFFAIREMFTDVPKPAIYCFDLFLEVG